MGKGWIKRLSAILLALAMIVPAALAEENQGLVEGVESVQVEEAPGAGLELGEIDLYDPEISEGEPCEPVIGEIETEAPEIIEAAPEGPEIIEAEPEAVEIADAEPDDGPKAVMASEIKIEAKTLLDLAKNKASASVLIPRLQAMIPVKMTLGENETRSLIDSKLDFSARFQGSINSFTYSQMQVDWLEEQQYLIEFLAVLAPRMTVQCSNKKVVSIADGGITGKKIGKATVTVKLDGEVCSRIKVTVKAAPKKVTVPKTLVVNRNTPARLKVTLPKKTASAISYHCDNNGNAAVIVDDYGTVASMSDSGTATVTVKTFNGKTAACKVTVLPGRAPTTLTLASTSARLCVGETVTLQPSVGSGEYAIFTYSSKNRKIATVSTDGVVKGKKKGKTKITVKTHNGLKKTFTVTVLKPPSKVRLNKKKVTLFVNNGFQLKPKIPKKTYTKYTYSTSNGKVATVDANGLIAAVGPGTAKITVRTLNGKKAACTVTVKRSELSGYYLGNITKAAKEIGGLKYRKDTEGFSNYENKVLWLWGSGLDGQLWSICLTGKSNYTLMGIKCGMSKSVVAQKMMNYKIYDQTSEGVTYSIGTKNDFEVFLDVLYDGNGNVKEVMYGSWP